MNTMRPTKIALITGLAAAALALSACGGDNPTTEPAAPASSVVAPSATEPASSAPASPSASASTESSPSPSVKTTEVPENDVELDVNDQSGSGSQIEIQQVLLPGDGFVAIYAPTGELLGSAEIGKSQTLTVKLDDKITKTGEYRAVLFADDGNGKFNADKDSQIIEIENDTDDDDDADDDADVVDDDFDYTVR